MYILIFVFLDSKLEDKGLCTECSQTFPDFKMRLISPWIECWFLRVFPYKTTDKIMVLYIFILEAVICRRIRKIAKSYY
jgi:hypothetical protein